MVKSFLEKGKSIFYSRQGNILSAASVIMLMVFFSRILGLIRNRTFVHFFEPKTLDTFLASFQLPDLIFEILVVGAMSSAFIPVFSRYLGQDQEKYAWRVAGITLNLLVLLFLILAGVIFIFASPIYSIVARGFSPEQVSQTVGFARILLFAQLFFVGSYVLTATLESNQRFLAPALAPLFYNLSIILATLFFAPSLGLKAPVLGAVFGSILHLLVQLPLAVSVGFRPVFSLNFKDPGVLRVVRLAMPRALELSIFQVKRLSDLFLASIISGGITYFKFADALAALPVGLFGLSLAKASLPQLARQTEGKDLRKFKKTFSSSFGQILFLVIPASIFITVLRIPLVRLAFGAAQFDWQDTVQTGYALSAFAVGAFAWACSLLVSRAFYALHDTLTPLKVSTVTVTVNVSLGFMAVLFWGLPIWGLALAYSIAGIVQLLILLFLLAKKVRGIGLGGILGAFLKIFTAGMVSGGLMFVLLKLFDRSAWDKNLSFLGKLGLGLPTTFDRFVLDTRYTVNLILLTFFVAAVGMLSYLVLSYLLRVGELQAVFNTLQRVYKGRLPSEKPAIVQEEPISPPHTNGS